MVWVWYLEGVCGLLVPCLDSAVLVDQHHGHHSQLEGQLVAQVQAVHLRHVYHNTHANTHRASVISRAVFPPCPLHMWGVCSFYT